LISVRIRLSVFPRQSPSSVIRFEMSADAEWAALAGGFFIVPISSQRFLIVTARGGHGKKTR
jgi:hypothetical protein